MSIPTAPTGATSVSPVARAETFVSTSAITIVISMVPGPIPNAVRPTSTRTTIPTRNMSASARVPTGRSAGGARAPVRRRTASDHAEIAERSPQRAQVEQQRHEASGGQQPERRPDQPRRELAEFRAARRSPRSADAGEHRPRNRAAEQHADARPRSDHRPGRGQQGAPVHAQRQACDGDTGDDTGKPVAWGMSFGDPSRNQVTAIATSAAPQSSQALRIAAARVA